MIIVPVIGFMTIFSCFMCVGGVGLGKLPTGVGEALFIIGALGGFGCFQMSQTTLSPVYSQIIPAEFIVSNKKDTLKDNSNSK